MEGILNDLNFEYLRSLRPKLDTLLRNISDYSKENEIPIVSYEVGKFLELMTLIKDPENVIEIGTAIGFSGIFIARALKTGGKLTTIDHSADSIKKAKENFTKAGLINKVNIILGDALKVLPKLEKEILADNNPRQSLTKRRPRQILTERRPRESLTETRPRRFDMAFIDAKKEEYKKYLERIIKLMEPGGIIIIDNLLWHGQTAGGPIISEKYIESTAALRKFNKFFLKHADITSTILPVGDGIGFALIK
jgi:predicted O-methyltransferase YrrM